MRSGDGMTVNRETFFFSFIQYPFGNHVKKNTAK